MHYLPGLHPLDVNEEIVEQAKFMGIHTIRKAELKNVSTCLVRRAFLIKLHHRGDCDTHPTEPPGEIQDVLTEFQSLFAEPPYANSQKGRQTDYQIKTDPNGKIPFRTLYRISRHEADELWWQIDKAIGCGRIQPSRSNFGSPVLFVPNA